MSSPAGTLAQLNATTRRRWAIKLANRQKSYLERETGIEPATLCLGSRCSTTELLPLGT